MTVDEALAAARRTNRCLIFWSSTTGEFVEVLGLEDQADRAHISALVQEVFRGRNATFSHNVFDSSTLTHELLQKQQSEALRLTGRSEQLRRWWAADPDELLRVLEKRVYPTYMTKDFDSTILVDHLWALHRDELTPGRQKRLALLIGTDGLSAKGSSHCNAYCLALQGESDKLRELWRAEFGSMQSLGALSVLIECFRHIQTQDLSVIQDIITMIDQPTWMFHPRYKAMIAVGGIDAARETNAAEIIRKAVHDSTPEIISTRDRALERLTIRSAGWRRCEDCCHGRIHGPSGFPIRCPICLGLGTVQILLAP
jgi:hypothetical protein